MENLTKQQIVLLTLLVSFVTSITTGIITVSLIDQAPVGVTQTINRVVERTIEKVVPQTTKNDSATVKETVVVGEGDQITKAIGLNKNTIVRLYKKDDGLETFVGLGVWASSDGKIIYPGALSIFNDESLIAQSSDGKKYNLVSVSSSTENKILISKAVSYTDSTSTIPVSFSKANLSSTVPQLGQTVVVLSGEKKDTVMNGIITSFDDVLGKIITASSATSSTSTTTDSYIETSVDATSLYTGSVLINLSGEVIGLRERNGNLFIPAGLIKRELATIK